MVSPVRPNRAGMVGSGMELGFCSKPFTLLDNLVAVLRTFSATSLLVLVGSLVACVNSFCVTWGEP